ncbi:hypothetical protein CFD26_103681 [Aspergillus turcosus]|uniref:Copper acquisition factor BIM1-like domain-containing protein n=1 Tax=Aspergillus turcosus TaxID=1245748 RepID=A0A421D5M7_9EURO|nr:hypothetical protein CFD26_103681 [Aspergillus turcosus]
MSPKPRTWALSPFLGHQIGFGGLRTMNTAPCQADQYRADSPVNPTRNDDFEPFMSATRIPNIKVGHECYPVPNMAADVEAGSNATSQINYTSNEDGAARNEPYYACADITYVPTTGFT